MSVSDFPPRPQGSEFESFEFQSWVDALGTRQNIDMQVATTPAPADELGVFDVSLGGYRKIAISDLFATAGIATTWTPVLTFGGGSTGITYGVQQGQVEVVGDFVLLSAYIQLTSKGSSTGTAKLTGLPQTINGLLYMPASLYMNSMAAAVTCPQAYGIINTTTIQFGNFATGTFTNLTDTGFTNTSEIMVSMQYKKA